MFKILKLNVFSV